MTLDRAKGRGLRGLPVRQVLLKSHLPPESRGNNQILCVYAFVSEPAMCKNFPNEKAGIRSEFYTISIPWMSQDFDR